MLVKITINCGMNTSVLNPQHYPVDLAKDIWQDKMDLIEEMRNKANGEGEAKMSLQEEIIQQLGVKPSIDPSGRDSPLG